MGFVMPMNLNNPPEWNAEWRRWEVIDDEGACEGMRGLSDEEMAAFLKDKIVLLDDTIEGMVNDGVIEITVREAIERHGPQFVSNFLHAP